MAKRRRVLPARKPRDRSRDDDSLLLRSAESLGRVIGALQRQLDGATKRLSNTGVGVQPRASKKSTTRKSSGAAKRTRKEAASRKRPKAAAKK